MRSQAQNGGAISVLIGVNGGPKVCTLPTCTGSGRTCPERDAQIALLEAKVAKAQACVRTLIESLGAPKPESFWLGNSMAALLTWDQIEMVAAHPHVTQIEASLTDTPPP